jgi:hypothetical protein
VSGTWKAFKGGQIIIGITAADARRLARLLEYVAEQKLDERQAWGKSNTIKTIPAIVLCRAHNLLQLFHATRKTEAAIADTKVITAYHKDLDRRAAKAKAAGRAFPRAPYQARYRPTELSLQFLRWIRYHLMRASCYGPALALLRPLMAPILIGISWTGFYCAVTIRAFCSRLGRNRRKSVTLRQGSKGTLLLSGGACGLAAVPWERDVYSPAWPRWSSPSGAECLGRAAQLEAGRQSAFRPYGAGGHIRAVVL